MYLDVLPGRVRGYKQPGRKLLPRDTYEGARMRMSGYFSLAPLRRDDAIQNRMMGYRGFSVNKRMTKKAEQAYYSGKQNKLPRPARKMLSICLAEEAMHAEKEAYGGYY